MTEPERLLSGSGPSARLLRSAELDVPGSRSRHRALAAAAGAATTLVAAGSAAAVGSTALVKSVAVWLCVGAMSGGTVAVVATYASEARQEPVPSAKVAAPARPPSKPAAPSEPRPAEPAEIEVPVTEVAAPPVARSAPAAASEPIVSVPPAVPGSGVASFDVPNARQALYDELKWIEAARAAAGRGDHAGALTTLDRYDAGYPQGNFRPESAALRIEALSRLGQRDRARALAERFRKDYPQHPLLAKVRAAVGE